MCRGLPARRAPAACAACPAPRHGCAPFPAATHARAPALFAGGTAGRLSAGVCVCAGSREQTPRLRQGVVVYVSHIMLMYLCMSHGCCNIYYVRQSVEKWGTSEGRGQLEQLRRTCAAAARWHAAAGTQPKDRDLCREVAYPRATSTGHLTRYNLLCAPT